MYTVTTKNIDGLDVVLGLDKEKIDQIATAKKIKPLVEATKEYKAFSERMKKVQGFNTSNASLDRQVRAIAERAGIRTGKSSTEVSESDLTEQELSQTNKHYRQREANTGEIEKIEGELPEVNEKLKKRTAEILNQNAIYFPVNAENENQIDDTTAESLKAKLKELKTGFVLLSDGTIKEDFRNKTYYGFIGEKWDIIKVDSLAETIDTGLYCLYEDLTDDEKRAVADQVETDRIAAMSDEDKADELALQKEGLISQAVNMRSKLEIQGDSEALVKSQEWLKEQTALIEDKYK